MGKSLGALTNYGKRSQAVVVTNAFVAATAVVVVVVVIVVVTEGLLSLRIRVIRVVMVLPEVTRKRRRVPPPPGTYVRY